MLGEITLASSSRKAETTSKNMDLANNSAPFIVNTSIGKANTASRKVIRSHVMRAKNKRMPKASPPRPGTWINSEIDHEARRTQAQIPKPRFEFAGTGLSTTRFADDMQPYMMDLVYKCGFSFLDVRSTIDDPQVFTILKQSLHPIEICLNVYPRSTIWFDYLYYDVMYLHSILWTTQAYFDWISPQATSKAALLHMSKTLDLLKYRLNDPRLAIADTTIFVVVLLVMTSALLGDHEAATKHITGLYRMVMLRGGLGALREDIQIQIKVCRYAISHSSLMIQMLTLLFREDLRVAVLTGAQPFFFSENLDWKPFLPKGTEYSAIPTSLVAILHQDKRIEHVWSDLASFSRSANLAFQTDHKISPQLFHEILISAMYRLLLAPKRNHEPSGNDWLEAIRLSMVGFSATILLQGHAIKMRFANLSEQLREAIETLDLGDQPLYEVRVWMLFVAGLSAVTDEDDGWLVPLLARQLSGESTWDGIRRLLKRFLWIDAIHDKDGRALFDRTLRPEKRACF